jgi:hypothetical protein
MDSNERHRNLSVSVGLGSGREALPGLSLRVAKSWSSDAGFGTFRRTPVYERAQGEWQKVDLHLAG